jgi:hypothetical protein
MRKVLIGQQVRKFSKAVKIIRIKIVEFGVNPKTRGE